MLSGSSSSLASEMVLRASDGNKTGLQEHKIKTHLASLLTRDGGAILTNCLTIMKMEIQINNSRIHAIKTYKLLRGS